ncbi:hypothetical protein D9611_004616 [Ephemerocybe angulata]|uniref:Protein OS-9 homolog n=1 Tax=Ephemerocybe angulata TaxID=980116 RepID=A0A8H5B502_9AGAR|nr:hypothetical protein D9611_004616 [Tulosesus angulatus]
MSSSSLLLLVLAAAVSARIHSLPEDTHAFPKYSVSFLNDLPILNGTAERWLAQGLRGGEPEFLDQPWKEDESQTPLQRKGIGAGGDTLADTHGTDPRSFAGTNYTIEHMKMGSKDSYVCYIPKPAESASTRQQEETETDATPARSWSLLQPLSGTCLYHRQGWFTYSYCHNQAIRQFKELAQPQARLLAGTYKPEEDQDWESYTLGRAPRSAEDAGADLTVAERNAQAANLELARNAGSRYLVQRWGDGTICDKTGKPREVEVQFHCSMVMTDHILFVKEAKTCSYVVVIHTPRLCGEPGFKSRRDLGEETLIRCREVVEVLPDKPPVRRNFISDQPFKTTRRNTVLPPPQPKEKAASASSSDDPKAKEELYNELLKNALEAFLLGNTREAGGEDSTSKTLKEAIEDGEVIVEFVDDIGGQPPEQSRKIVEALRAAGYDVRSESVKARKSGKKSDDKDAAALKEKEGKSDGPPPKAKGRLQKILQEHLEL